MNSRTRLPYGDERFVKQYRETTPELLMSWEARGLWQLVRFHFDRAGLLTLGPNLAEGLAVQLRIPEELAVKALAEWTSRELVIEKDGVLIDVDHVAAQRSRKTARQRQRDHRATSDALKNAKALGITLHDDAPAAMSHNVTPGNETPPTVTPRKDKTSVDEKEGGGPVGPVLHRLSSSPAVRAAGFCPKAQSIALRRLQRKQKLNDRQMILALDQALCEADQLVGSPEEMGSGKLSRQLRVFVENHDPSRHQPSVVDESLTAQPVPVPRDPALAPLAKAGARQVADIARRRCS